MYLAVLGRSPTADELQKSLGYFIAVESKAEATQDLMWALMNSRGRPHEVGEFPPNNWGLYDMHGNVWEFCSDWHDESGEQDGGGHSARRMLRT